MKRALLALFGAVAGFFAGFAILFYGYLALHPPGPSGVEFETASPLAFFVGAPVGLFVGAIAGYLLAKWTDRT